jgi:hypothetical protein
MTSPPFHAGAYIFSILSALMVGLLWGCGSGGSDAGAQRNEINLIFFSEDWPEAGTQEALCSVAAAQAIDSTFPEQVVGDGTPASCTSEAVVAALAAGGVIVFDRGPDPVTITMMETAKVFNDGKLSQRRRQGYLERSRFTLIRRIEIEFLQNFLFYPRGTQPLRL